jgi:hypothetical protein
MQVEVVQAALNDNKNLLGLSLRANYTDLAIAAYQRS